MIFREHLSGCRDMQMMTWHGTLVAWETQLVICPQWVANMLLDLWFMEDFVPLTTQKRECLAEACKALIRFVCWVQATYLSKECKTISSIKR